MVTVEKGVSEEESDSDSEEADSETEGTDTGVDSDKSRGALATPPAQPSKAAGKKGKLKSSLSETRIVGGVAIATVNNDTPLSVTSSSSSVRSQEAAVSDRKVGRAE